MTSTCVHSGCVGCACAPSAWVWVWGWCTCDGRLSSRCTACAQFWWLSNITGTYNYYPRRAWAATGLVVCQSVCLFVCLSVISICSPGCHSTAFTTLITSKQQVITFIVADFDVELCCRKKAKKLVSECAYLKVFNGVFTAWIAFTQQIVSLVVADLDVKASLSNKS